MASVEFSAYSPESAALQALIDPSQIILFGSQLRASENVDEWTMHGGHGFLEGFFEIHGRPCHTNILICFPGFFERALARVRKR